MPVTIYRQPVDGQKHYSPPEIIGTQTVRCAGKLDPAHFDQLRRTPELRNADRANRPRANNQAGSLFGG